MLCVSNIQRSTYADTGKTHSSISIMMKISKRLLQVRYLAAAAQDHDDSQFNCQIASSSQLQLHSKRLILVCSKKLSLSADFQGHLQTWKRSFSADFQAWAYRIRLKEDAAPADLPWRHQRYSRRLCTRNWEIDYRLFQCKFLEFYLWRKLNGKQDVKIYLRSLWRIIEDLLAHLSYRSRVLLELSGEHFVSKRRSV